MFVSESLVVLALYQTRKMYMTMYLSDPANVEVKNLTTVLLADFDI